MRFIKVHPVKAKRIFAIWLQLLIISVPVFANAEEQRQGSLTSGGTYYVEYRTAYAIPLNKIFDIDFTILDGKDKKKSVIGAVLTASAWMPEHNHGTSLQAKIKMAKDGTAKGSGFLFHMEGFWQLHIGVMANGVMERAVFDIHLEP